MSAIASSIEQLEARSAAARRTKLYLGTAVLLAGLAFAGFAQSYWVPMSAGTLALHPAVHVHGALFFLWTLLFVVQTALVERGRTAWHRKLGLFGIALALLMVFSGVLVQLVTLRAGLQGPQPDVARNVAAVGFSALGMFTLFVALAIANVRRPERHRPLMVLASFAIIGAAVARLMRFVPDTTQPERVLLATILVDLLLAAVVVLDRRAVGRVHPVWLAGGAFLVVNQVGRLFVARTDGWAAITDWLAALAG